MLEFVEGEIRGPAGHGSTASAANHAWNRFHNGDPFTADDVRFSFQRYKGASAKLLKERVREIEVVNAHRVRFQLAGPWADFFTIYGTPASGTAWTVPKGYLKKVGEEGFQRAPV